MYASDNALYRCGLPSGRRGINTAVWPLRASFTVEAAVAVPLALISLAGMIMGGLKLHDRLVSNFTANEAAELFGHLPEDGDQDSITSYGNTRLGSLLTNMGYVMSIEEYKRGSVVTVEGNEESKSYTDGGFRPEQFMRKITVIEEVLGND